MFFRPRGAVHRCDCTGLLHAPCCSANRGGREEFYVTIVVPDTTLYAPTSKYGFNYVIPAMVFYSFDNPMNSCYLVWPISLKCVVDKSKIIMSIIY